MLDVRGLVAGGQVAGGVASAVLQGVDLHVAASEVVAVVGRGGMGKTTLNRALSGLIPARRGRVRFLDEDITGADHVRIVRAGLIHVPQGGRVFPTLSVHDNLLLGATVRNRRQRTAMLAWVLEVFPRLGGRLRQEAGAMDCGAQRQLAIGRGLMAAPRLLILDEPSLGLSWDQAEEVFALIVRLHRQGLSVLLSERDLGRSLAVANRAYVIDRGRVALEGPAARLAADPALAVAWGGPC